MEEKESGKPPDRPTRTAAAEWSPELGDRQHQPHQVHLPGDRQFLVDLLQAPGRPDRHLTLGRGQPQGPARQARIDTMIAPRHDVLFRRSGAGVACE